MNNRVLGNVGLTKLISLIKTQLRQLVTSINKNTSDIATNKTNITANTNNIAINTRDIATNRSNIINNTTAIQTNATNIATNTSAINTNTSDITNIKNNIGDLSDLTTSDKSSIVNAINEIDSNTDANSQAIEEIQTSLDDFALISESAYKITLQCTTDTYELTAKLFDKNNNLLSTSNVIDLPLESLVVSASYDSTRKMLIITLQSGSTIEVPLGDLISGLVSQDDFDELSNTVDTLSAEVEDKVDKVTGKGLSTNDLTNELKQNYDVAYNQTHTHSNKTILDNTTASYTTAEKTKLENIETGAEVNVIESISVNGVPQTVTDKNVDLNIENELWERGTGDYSVQTIIDASLGKNEAKGEASVAEGVSTKAHAFASHTEGYQTSTRKDSVFDAEYAHAEGYGTNAGGPASHAEGNNTVTNNPYEHAEGRYNKSNMGGTAESNTIHSVGIGTASMITPGGDRKNAFEIMQSGDAYLIGLGDYDGTNPTSSDSLQDILDVVETIEDGNILHLDNAKQSGALNYTIYGKSVQETYQGNNILNIVGEITHNGVTSKGTSDGTLTISGSTTSTSTNFTGINSISGDSGGYLFSIDRILSFDLKLRLTLDNGSYVYVTITAGSTQKTFTLNRAMTAYRLYQDTLPTGTAINTTIKPMINLGYNLLDFEPYVGGIPSPNTSYPQKINTVHGTENLLFIEETEETLNGVTVKVNKDKSITINGTPTINTSIYLPINLVFKQGITYTYTTKYKLTSNKYTTSFRKADKSIVYSGTGLDGSLNNRTITATSNETAKYIAVYTIAGVEFNNYTIYPMVEEGEIINEFVPYGNWLKISTTNTSEENNLYIDFNKYNDSHEVIGKFELASVEDIKDELNINLGKITITKRIDKIDNYDGESITSNYISTTGGLDTGATIYYVSDTQEEIDITNDNINLFKGTNTVTLYSNVTTNTKINYIKETPLTEVFVNHLDLNNQLHKKQDTLISGENVKTINNESILGEGNIEVIGGNIPVGTISLWAGETAPKNYMICDGREISRSLYADLFNIIGTTYGAGDGSTTFNIPDYRGLVPVGLKVNETYFDELGKTGGTIKHKHILPLGAESASFYIGVNEETTSINIGTGKYNSNWSGNTSSSINAISSREELTLQPYIVQNYIIKVSKEATEETLVEAVPMGTILDYDGDTVPVGYEEVSNQFTSVGVILYDNTGGTKGNITLNDSAENYYKLEILYNNDDSKVRYSAIILNPNGFTHSITRCEVDSSAYMIDKKYSINDVSMNKVSSYAIRLDTTEPIFEYDNLRVYKVIGYKEV